MRFLPRGIAVGSSAMVAGSAAMAPACGSDSSCEETRSCGVAGKDGGGGSSGDSAPDAPTVCEKDGDCDNGLVCDGEATCVEHVCVAGTPISCINPDATHCSAACVEPSGECEISANDKVGDEHLDASCSFATTLSRLPSDDCDDSHETVYPEAPEICDGLDNDCDMKVDVFDGLPLSGTRRRSLRPRPWAIRPLRGRRPRRSTR